MNDLQKELVSSVQKFCQDKIASTIANDEENSFFSLDIYKGLGDLGVTGIVMPEEYGGLDLTYSDLVLVLSELAKYSVAYAVTLSVSTMVMGIINRNGTDQQKKKFLPKLISGEEIGAFSLSEAGAGSDVHGLTTSFVEKGDKYLLNGNKMWTTSGGIAKTYIVLARNRGTETKRISALLVRDGASGFNYGKVEVKMGLNVSPTRELIFDNCQIAKENLLGDMGKGLGYALAGLDAGRISIGAIAVGLSRVALKEAMKYALVRKQFKKNIFDFQGIGFMFADLATEIEASWSLVSSAGKLFDEDQTCVRKLAAMSKLKATEVAMRVTTDCVQLLGGVGYTREYPLERFMREAKCLQIVEGTSQIQKVIISRLLKKEFIY